MVYDFFEHKSNYMVLDKICFPYNSSTSLIIQPVWDLLPENSLNDNFSFPSCAILECMTHPTVYIWFDVSMSFEP